MDSGSVIKLETLNDLDEVGGAELVEEMINLVLASIPERIAAIRDALHGSDTACVAARAHSIKSSAGNVGAMRLLSLANDIEARARVGDLGDDTLALMAELEAEFSRVHSALRNHVSGLTTG
jgi:HPt (histidine-containing phosphotransfer) domain-containing protein